MADNSKLQSSVWGDVYPQPRRVRGVCGGKRPRDHEAEHGGRHAGAGDAEPGQQMAVRHTHAGHNSLQSAQQFGSPMNATVVRVTRVGAAPDRDSTAPAQPTLGGVLPAIAAIGAAEVLIMQGHVLAAAVADAVVVFALLNVEWLRATRLGKALPTWESTAAMRVLAIVPFSRVVAVALPLADLSPAVAELVTAGLVGMTAIGFAAPAGLSREVVLKRRGGDRLIATCAVLGLIGYLLGAPVLVDSGAGPLEILLALVAASAAAAVEEVVFRGLVQRSLQRIAGRAGILAAIALSVFAYLGFGSVAIVLLVAYAVLLFARRVATADALGDAIVGHVVLAASAAVLWPLLLGIDPPDILLLEPVLEVGLAIGVAWGVFSLSGPNVAWERA